MGDSETAWLQNCNNTNTSDRVGNKETVWLQNCNNINTSDRMGDSYTEGCRTAITHITQGGW